MKKKQWPVYIKIAAAVVVAVCAAAWSGRFPDAARVLHFQFGPAFMSLFSAFSSGALFAAVLIVLTTFLFGRFYCAALCPAGIWQDFVAWALRRKKNETRDFKKTRYAVAGIVVGLLCGGTAAGFLFSDPYSSFGRAVSSFSLGASVPFIVITVLAVWKRRVFCTSLCPVGTILGLCAEKGVFRLEVGEGCVKCGLCAKACPAGCINPAEGTIDNARCVRCLRCLPACGKGAISFVRRKENKEKIFCDSRRSFFIGAGTIAAAAAAGFVLAKSGLIRFGNALKNAVLPPGAGDAERFAARCTDCRLCVRNCPAGIIVPASGVGPVSLNLNKAACLFDCNKCSRVCPTGAIRPLSLAQKQSCKIAEAKLDVQKCIKCGLCARSCPSKAIEFKPENIGRKPPVIDASRCVGCAACMHVCPVGAISVLPVEKQIFIEKRS